MSAYLADANALIVYATDPARLPAEVKRLLRDRPGDVGVLATTIWEIAIKVQIGKLPELAAQGHASFAELWRKQGLEPLTLTAETAERAAALPMHHKDPFDRALIALSLRTGRPVLTNDALFERYGVVRVWD